MRYAVLSDIHGNLEALTAVLDRIAGTGADGILCLGDIVGYHANPNECIDIVRSGHMVCVLGNHDSAASGLSEPDAFSPLARQALLWTRRQLAPAGRAFLRDLPRELASLACSSATEPSTIRTAISCTLTTCGRPFRS